MPKISTKFISVLKGTDKNYSVTIMYNATHHFYCEIPEDFKNTAQHLAEEEFKRLHLYKVYKKKYARDGEFNIIITAPSEIECADRIKEAVNYLAEAVISYRPVIIVFYDPDRTTSIGGYHYNRKHPPLGLQFALTYAKESTLGDQKTYISNDGNSIHLWRGDNTIIDDTPENRQTLEQIYSALENLIGKLKSLTTDSETLTQFIASGIKLLK